MPKVSIIIPTYNRLSHLPRAIDSIQNQSETDWELLVVDDGSTDQTNDWIKAHPLFKSKKLKYFYQSNKGVSSARNFGIISSQSELICFLDSDDEWLPNKLSNQLELLKSQPYLNWMHTEEIWIRNDIQVNPCKHHKKGGGRQFVPSLERCVISPSTIMIKKDCMMKMGNFREDFPVCEDYELWLKLSSRFPIGFIERPQVKKYGGHIDQLSHKYFAMDYWRIIALQEYIDSPYISNHENIEVLKVLFKKIKVLQKGYLKHNNLNDWDKIQDIKLKVQKRMNDIRACGNFV